LEPDENDEPQKETSSLDDTDRKLVSLLMKDGRTSLSELGDAKKGVNMSHVAVSKRLEKLINDDKLVKVAAGVNAEALDIKVLFLGLETENMEITDMLLKKYNSCPRLVMLAPVTGRYNLFAVMVAEDTFSLESILGTCSLRTEDGIRRSETWFGNSPSIPQYLPIDLAPSKKGGNKATCGRDCSICKRYEVNKCVGCPSTKTYKGGLWAKTDGRKTQAAKSKS
jgi:Lrp/AsnC family leucine-responsive transcriptional regulator